MGNSSITRARQEFHCTLLEKTLTKDNDGRPSNADRSSVISISLATEILKRLGPSITGPKLPGQTSGSHFEIVCQRFVEVCFQQLSHLRPGNFVVYPGRDISRFDQYSHLATLEKIAESHREFATSIGSDYIIKPDIIVARKPEPDRSFNTFAQVLDKNSANLTSLRKANQELEILHASISCKWTIRSDRAQNSRSEALNLVRNRKGKQPHIAVITAEPTPNRISSLALGTGDIDCVYHFALNELRDSLISLQRDDSLDLLDSMIEGKRLRDISDLPIDLIT